MLNISNFFSFKSYRENKNCFFLFQFGIIFAHFFNCFLANDLIVAIISNIPCFSHSLHTFAGYHNVCGKGTRTQAMRFSG